MTTPHRAGAYAEGDLGTVTIRRATRADVPSLVELEAAFPGDRISRASFQRFLASSRTHVWVAAGEHDATQLHGDAIISFPARTRTAHLLSLVVGPHARRRGVALALLSAVEEDAIARGYRAIRLDVRTDNDAARRLYGRAGYHANALVPRYYEDGCDAVRMAKTLPEGTIT